MRPHASSTDVFYLLAVVLIAVLWGVWPWLGPWLQERYRRRTVGHPQGPMCTWDPNHTMAGVLAVQRARVHDAHGTFVLERFVCSSCARRASDVSHRAPVDLVDV